MTLHVNIQNVWVCFKTFLHVNQSYVYERQNVRESSSQGWMEKSYKHQGLDFTSLHYASYTQRCTAAFDMQILCITI